jgi:hypothetical protein
MVNTVMLHRRRRRRRRISFSCPPVHLVGGNLSYDVEENGKVSGRCSYGVVNLVLSTYVIGLVLGYSD